MNKECPARLSFPQAPFLDLVCHEPPGHEGLHKTWAYVRAALRPYDVWQRDAFFLEGPKDVTRERVYMSWDQDVSNK